MKAAQQTVVLENCHGQQTEITVWVDCPPVVIRRPRFDNVTDVLKPLDEDVYRFVGYTESGLELFRQDPVKITLFSSNSLLGRDRFYEQFMEGPLAVPWVSETTEPKEPAKVWKWKDKQPGVSEWDTTALETLTGMKLRMLAADVQKDGVQGFIVSGDQVTPVQFEQLHLGRPWPDNEEPEKEK